MKRESRGIDWRFVWTVSGGITFFGMGLVYLAYLVWALLIAICVAVLT